VSHIPRTDIHRYVGDEFTLRVTVDGLTQGQVTAATWRCGEVSKAKDDGITVEDDEGAAVLVVTITSADTTLLGSGVRSWQAAAGANPPPIVAAGTLNLEARV
jgi:hypothetical protein